jgi:hypothetical protein
MSFYILIQKIDVNKKIVGGFLSLVLLVLILFTNSVKGYSYYNTSLETDKDTYFTHEKIKINASWELYYNPDFEISYTRIQILDNFDEILWKSAKYYAMGVSNKNWTVYIQALNITYSNFSDIIFIRIYNYYQNSQTSEEREEISEILSVNLVKNSISCQLTGFKDNLIIGDSNSFSAYFFNTETGDCLANETFLFLTTYNEEIIFQNNLTSNESGEVAVNLSTITHLNLGKNQVKFSPENNVLYNDTTFSYDVFVNKIPVLVNITNIENNLEEANLIEIQLYYYYFNQSEQPIENKDVKLIFYTNSIAEYESNLKIDQTGFLNITIFPKNIIFKAAAKEIYVNVIFNGTGQLENKTVSFNFKIENISYQGISYLFLSTNFCLGSVITILLLFIGLKAYNLKRTKFKLIKDITFKF